ncbi:MAG TPA: DUF3267 domain-containing protein [Candidatus Dormibacteraeota bacterium]
MTSADEPSQQETVVDWRPGRAEATIWNVVAIVLIALGLPLFALPSVLRHGPAGASFRIGLTEISLVVAITVLLLVMHEGIHALVMLAFRARPSFGVVLVGGAMPALYATSAGHRFSRSQYLTVAATPAVVISVLGFLLCSGPWGGYLIVPLAIHLGGCVGDAFACGRVLRERPGTEFEDLRDGIRFHRKPA